MLATVNVHEVIRRPSLLFFLVRLDFSQDSVEVPVHAGLERAVGTVELIVGHDSGHDQTIWPRASWTAPSDETVIS